MRRPITRFLTNFGLKVRKEETTLRLSWKLSNSKRVQRFALSFYGMMPFLFLKYSLQWDGTDEPEEIVRSFPGHWRLKEEGGHLLKTFPPVLLRKFPDSLKSKFLFQVQFTHLLLLLSWLNLILWICFRSQSWLNKQPYLWGLPTIVLRKLNLSKWLLEQSTVPNFKAYLVKLIFSKPIY